MEASILINAPVERVFAFCSDPNRWPGAISAIKRVEKLTEGPVRVGTKINETRIMFGKETTEAMEFTAFDPPHHYTLSGVSCGAAFATTFRFVPEAGGTRVTMAMAWKSQTFFSKVIGFLLLPLMKGHMIKMFNQELADVKKHLEADAATAVS